MTNAPFMQLYVADYLADTQHLTTEQHGAYLLLLMTMWRNAGSLPNDEKKLARIAHVTLKRWHIIADDVMEFFDIEDDVVTQKRLVDEFQKAVSKSEKRKTSGSLGGKAKSLKNNGTGLANANELPKHSSETDIDIKKDTNVSQKKGCRLPDDFEPDFTVALSSGFTSQEAQSLFANFKDYWTAKTGKDATKLDWQATWRNWVRSPYSQKFKGNNHANTGNPRKSFSECVTDEMQRIADEYGFNQTQPADDDIVSTIFPDRDETGRRADRQNVTDRFSGQTLTLVASNHG